MIDKRTGSPCHLDSLPDDWPEADIVELVLTTSQRKDVSSSGWGNWKGMLTTNSTRMQHDKKHRNTYSFTHIHSYILSHTHVCICISNKKDSEMPKRQKRIASRTNWKQWKQIFWTDIRQRLGNTLNTGYSGYFFHFM